MLPVSNTGPVLFLLELLGLHHILLSIKADIRKKYITYLISYSIRPEVCGKQPLAEVHFLENGPAMAGPVPAPLNSNFFAVSLSRNTSITTTSQLALTSDYFDVALYRIIFHVH